MAVATVRADASVRCIQQWATAHGVLTGGQIGRALGAGASGAVHQLCLGTGAADCTFAAKFEPINEPWQLEHARKEAGLQQALAQYGVGPRYFGAFYCEHDRMFVIVTELWDGGALRSGELMPMPLVRRLEAQIAKMHALGWMHSDVLPKNVLVRRDALRRIVDVTLADFGLSRRFDSPWDPAARAELVRYFLSDADAHAALQYAVPPAHARSPADLERYVYEHPELLDAALIGWLLATHQHVCTDGGGGGGGGGVLPSQHAPATGSPPVPAPPRASSASGEEDEEEMASSHSTRHRRQGPRRRRAIRRHWTQRSSLQNAKTPDLNTTP